MPLQETSGAASYDAFGGGAAAINYVDDVFSTWLYNGTGATQTITNGIDLVGKGGLVWFKSRGALSSDHGLYDTSRGGGSVLYSNLTNAAGSVPSSLTFNSNGFSITDTYNYYNNGSNIYTSWTFREQPKFFDVVTYTGSGVSGKVVSHNLGSVPGCIIIKRTDGTGDAWCVWHRGIHSATNETSRLILNTTDANTSFGATWLTSVTSTAITFAAGFSNFNANGGTYVAYLFAHDAGGFGASGSDNVISCGSYTGNGSTTGPVITLGYEPQWLLIKAASGTGLWELYDNMRGLTVEGQNDARLIANDAGAESSGSLLAPLATGFQITNNGADRNASGVTYIYIAIRRPNKPPTTGTQVFTPTVYTGTNVDNRLVNTTTLADMVWVRQRNSSTVAGMVVGDRLRGQPYLLTGSDAGEVNDADSFDAQVVSTVEYGTAFSSINGFWVGNDATSQLNASTTSNNQIAEAFKRAPGFFDVVCYTGTGSATTVSHNLGVVPELMIVKCRSAASRSWEVYHSGVAADAETDYLRLNSNQAVADNATFWNDTKPTASVFTVGTTGGVNTVGDAYVAYLFASLPGISKVGSYTGNGGTAGTNGTSQTINCGFTTGARFVLVKSVGTGDWYVFDSARGIVAGNDPYIKLNTTNAEASVDDVVVDNSGFIVSQMNGTNLNVTSATYIYLAIA